MAHRRSKPQAGAARGESLRYKDRGSGSPAHARWLSAIVSIAGRARPPGARTLKGSQNARDRSRRRSARRLLGLLPAATRPRSDRHRPPGHARRGNQLCQRRAGLRQPRRTLGQPQRAAQGAAVAGAGGCAPAVSHARRSAPVAVVPVLSAQLHARAHAPQHPPDRQPGHLQPRRTATTAPRHGHPVRAAHAGHSALLHQRQGVRRRPGPGRANAPARLRAPRHRRRRGRAHRAGAGAHPSPAGRRDLHGGRRIGRRQPVCTRTGHALHASGRALSPGRTHHRAAHGGRRDRPCGADQCRGTLRARARRRLCARPGLVQPAAGAAAGAQAAHLPGQGLFRDHSGQGRAPGARGQPHGR